MTTIAQQSATQAQIIYKLETATHHHNYAIQLRDEAYAMLPELFPVGSIAVGGNGTQSIVTGHKGDQIAICNVGSTNAGWSHWKMLNLKHL